MFTVIDSARDCLWSSTVFLRFCYENNNYSFRFATTTSYSDYRYFIFHDIGFRKVSNIEIDISVVQSLLKPYDNGLLTNQSWRSSVLMLRPHAVWNSLLPLYALLTVS